MVQVAFKKANRLRKRDTMKKELLTITRETSELTPIEIALGGG